MTEDVVKRRIESNPAATADFLRTVGLRLDSLSRVHGYVPALIAFGVATALVVLFRASFGPKFIGIAFVYFAFMIIASWCGYVPGILGMLAVSVGVPFLLTPGYSLSKVSLPGIGMLVLLSAMVSRGAANRRHSEERLRLMNEELERRVREQTAELAKANAGLEHQITALRRANADLEQFAYSASHDLQEPIRNVAIYGQILGKHYRHALDESGLKFLGFITEGAQRMELLVKDLLAYTQTGTDEAPVGIVDANETLEKVLSILGAATTEAQAQVVYEKLPRLYIHDVHLQQLFQNLIGNSLKYRSPRSPRIRLTAADVDNCWRFAVEDNGIGIDSEYQEKIFGIFKRLHQNGKYSGTGIGLAICKRIVERYGGRIWVESRAGEGATFFFTIRKGQEPSAGQRHRPPS
jgi:signal transduction histidine kinase